jgi:hypothetical protein
MNARRVYQPARGAGIRRQMPTKPSRLFRVITFVVIAVLAPVLAAFWVGIKLRNLYGFGR